LLFCSKLGQKVDILKINTCPLCGGKHLGHAITCTDHYASGEQFNLVRCDDCGFIFTQGAPVEAEIGRYYETPDYISHTDTRKGLMNRVYHEVRKYMLSRKAKLIKRTSGLSKGTLLDIGTGTGYFSNAMKERGWRVKAIEKSPQARSFAKEHFELDVDTEDALAGYADHSFDAITLWHVMEHLEHLNETWEKLFKLLKERGVLIVAVPNPSSYDAEKYKEWWAAYDVPRHLWHFTPRKYMLSRKAKLIKRTSGLSKGTLLDIGTGTGYFSNTMKERGWRVKAIEKSPQARAFAKEHFELDVDTEDALAGYADHSFDAITLWHVMEHLEHLNETWEKLFKLLKERGVLIVAVPNPSSYDAEKYKEWWAAYDVPRHLWHFTPSVMQQFGVKHGFKLAEQHPMPFDAFYVSMLTERYKGSRLSFLKGMWTGLLAWFSSLAKKERSSSMIYVFRKK